MATPAASVEVVWEMRGHAAGAVHQTLQFADLGHAPWPFACADLPVELGSRLTRLRECQSGRRPSACGSMPLLAERTTLPFEPGCQVDHGGGVERLQAVATGNQNRTRFRYRGDLDAGGGDDEEVLGVSADRNPRLFAADPVEVVVAGGAP